MNEYDKIMTENFTERFVSHGNIGLASETVAELALNHRKGCFDIGPLMVMRQKLVPLELKVVVHLGPRSAAIPPVVRGKRDVRRGSKIGDRIGVRTRSVSLVGGDFGNLKVLGGSASQRGKELGVVCVLAVNFNSGHNVGLDAAHKMDLDPIVLLSRNAVLVIVPAGEMACSEAGRIDGKIRFDRLERQTALLNEIAENGGQFGILKIVGNGIEVRNLGDKPPLFGLPQVTHKPALRNGGINFEHDTENGVGQRQAWSASLGRGSKEARAEIGQQDLEFILFVSLGLIVSGPVLRIRVLRLRDSDLLSDRRTSVAVVLPLQNKLDGKDMLALDAARLVIGASARRDLRHHVDLVDRTVAGLRGHEPNALLAANLLGRRQFHSSLLSKVHDFLLYLANILLARCIEVKRNLQESFDKLLDNISLPSVLLIAWEWSQFGRKAIGAVAASTNGCPDQVQRASRESVPNVNRPIGISLGSTS